MKKRMQKFSLMAADFACTTWCYRCREYDHYVNECQNAVTSDSEGHGSDNAALQIMATDMESDDMRDIDRYREETEYLNL